MVETLVDAVGDLGAPVEGVDSVVVRRALGEQGRDVGEADQPRATLEFGIDGLVLLDEAVEPLRPLKELT